MAMAELISTSLCTRLVNQKIRKKTKTTTNYSHHFRRQSRAPMAKTVCHSNSTRPKNTISIQSYGFHIHLQSNGCQKSDFYPISNVNVIQFNQILLNFSLYTRIFIIFNAFDRFSSAGVNSVFRSKQKLFIRLLNESLLIRIVNCVNVNWFRFFRFLSNRK